MTVPQDYIYMARALRLAKRGIYTTDPNPRVGCVLVNDNSIVGEGWHEQTGGPHAEIMAVPEHLVASVPDSVSLVHAAFTVLGSSALQGVRLAEVSLGEKVLVIGLGLIGQLAVAILNAAGCIVFGTDPDAAKCELA